MFSSLHRQSYQSEPHINQTRKGLDSENENVKYRSRQNVKTSGSLKIFKLYK